MNTYESVVARPREGVLSTNKLIRNTYLMLSMTLLFSALMAGVSTAMTVSPGMALISDFIALGLLFFALPRTANSAAGIGVVFAITGLLGFGLGPTLTYHLALPNGPQVVMTATAGTGLIFMGLSAYALTTRKDFSFLGGFLMAGLLVVIFAAIVGIFVQMPALQLAISSAVILLMSGFILYDTSRMVHQPNGNYLMMTVSLYLDILNLFVSLLHILGIFSSDD